MEGSAVFKISTAFRFVQSQGQYFPATYATFFTADNSDELDIVSGTSFGTVLAFFQGVTAGTR